MQDKDKDINEEKKIMREGLRILAKIIAEKIFDDLLNRNKKRLSNKLLLQGKETNINEGLKGVA